MRQMCALTLALSVACLTFDTGCHSSQRLTPAGILTESEVRDLQAAAIRQAPFFLNRIPAGRERQFGFDNREQFARILPGPPFTVCSIGPDQVLGETVDGRDIQVLNEFRVPLIADGRARALLTIEPVEGGYRATDLGAATLAGELDQTLRDQGFNIDSTRQGSILRLYQVRSDFLIPEVAGPGEEIRVIPLKSARIALGLDSQKPFVSTLTKMLPSIRHALSSADIAETIPDGVTQP